MLGCYFGPFSLCILSRLILWLMFFLLIYKTVKRAFAIGIVDLVRILRSPKRNGTNTATTLTTIILYRSSVLHRISVANDF